jgi:hypothetical protein
MTAEESSAQLSCAIVTVNRYWQFARTGQHPFGGGPPFDTVHAILNAGPERLIPDDRIPRRFAEPIESILSKDFTKWPSASESDAEAGRDAAWVPSRTARSGASATPGFGLGAALAVILIGAVAAWMKIVAGYRS